MVGSAGLLAVVAATALALAGCGNDAEPTSTASPAPAAQSLECPDGLAFTPTVFPEGVERELKEGLGGEGQDYPQLIENHYAQDDEHFIDIKQGGALYPVADPQPLNVLDVVAESGAIEGGWGVNFLLEGGRCGRYEISAYGFEANEVKSFAQGLKPVD